MTYAFIIVVSVAITLKLMFMSFSLYVTLKQGKSSEAAKSNGAQEKRSSSLVISWKKLQRIILPNSIYCPEGANKNNSSNKL